SKLPYDDPFKDYPHYVALVLLPAGRQQKREANVFHGTKLAEKWVSVILDELTPEQRRGAQVKIQKFANRAQAVQFARRWQAGR
ncbi:MAG: hypothetical protein GY888_27435, partial [Planctomycetaceae bacterium]|nr:hypothetical protein [Planctomycetaceae bacterium]